MTIKLDPNKLSTINYINETVIFQKVRRNMILTKLIKSFKLQVGMNELVIRPHSFRILKNLFALYIHIRVLNFEFKSNHIFNTRLFTALFCSIMYQNMKKIAIKILLFVFVFSLFKCLLFILCFKGLHFIITKLKIQIRLWAK